MDEFQIYITLSVGGCWGNSEVNGGSLGVGFWYWCAFVLLIALI